MFKNKTELMKRAATYNGKHDGFMHCEMRKGKSELIVAGRPECIAHMCFVALNRVCELTNAPIELLLSFICDESGVKYDIGENDNNFFANAANYIDFPNSDTEL